MLLATPDQEVFKRYHYLAPIAQLVEQHPLKVMVAGSIPAGCTQKAGSEPRMGSGRRSPSRVGFLTKPERHENCGFIPNSRLWVL